LPSRASSTTVPGSVSRVDMRRGPRPQATHASGRPAVAVALPRPGLRRLGSRAQDPSIRAVCRTSRITVRQRPSSPSASRALVRQSPAPLHALSDVLSGAPCPCPLSAAPRASLPLTALSPGRGEDRWTSKTLFSSNRRPDPAPREAGWRSNPSRSSTWSPVTGWTPARLACASRTGSLDPPLREERVGGGPPCRQVGQLSWVFVPRRTGSQVRAIEWCGLIRFSDQTLASLVPYERFASGSTPRRRDAGDPRSFLSAPTSHPVEDTVSRSPEPVELSPAGVS